MTAATVTRTITVTKPDSNTFKVVVDLIDLRGNAQDEVPLQWDISNESPDWHFPTGQNAPDGIAINNDTGSVFGQVSCGAKRCTSKRNSGKAYTGPGTVQRTYDYTITVTDGDKTLIIDPTIINEP